jgi:hypothetical protein
MFRLIPILLMSVLSVTGLCQTTQPAAPPRLDYRAARAFDRGDYATALPLLRQLATEWADKPAKLAVVQKRIAICEQQLAAVPQTQPAVRIPHQLPAAGQTLEMTIKDLGNFDYDQDRGGNIPDDVKRLDGCKIRLRGYMIPIDQAEHITQFALVPSLFSCCFGQPPQIQHTIVTTTPKGMAVSYSPDEVIVDGTLSVREKKDDGYIVSIFEVTATSLKQAPR